MVFGSRRCAGSTRRPKLTGILKQEHRLKASSDHSGQADCVIDVMHSTSGGDLFHPVRRAPKVAPHDAGFAHQLLQHARLPGVRYPLPDRSMLARLRSRRDTRSNRIQVDIRTSRQQCPIRLKPQTKTAKFRASSSIRSSIHFLRCSNPSPHRNALRTHREMQW